MIAALKPGAETKISGQYKEINSKSIVQSDTEITSVKGKKLPPTHAPGNSWILVDKTKHKK